MPRANNVLCIGAVAAFASEKVNKEGELVQVALPVVAIHGTRSYGAKIVGNIESDEIQNKGYDTLWIMTKDPATMQLLRQCKPFDIVECKGVIRVTMQKKKVFCPECSEKHVYYTTVTTIYPIYFNIRQSLTEKHGIKVDRNGFDKDTSRMLRKEAHQILKNCIEVSNMVTVTGAVSKTPDLHCRESDGLLMMTFPLAILRKYRVREDDTNTNIDFPFVKVYGKKAREQDGRLRAKNVITIEGFLMTRSFVRMVECEHCGIKYKVDDQVSEIIPYEIEWIRNDVNVSEFNSERDADYKYNPKVIGSEADIDLKRYVDTTVGDVNPNTIVVDPEVAEALKKLEETLTEEQNSEESDADTESGAEE